MKLLPMSAGLPHSCADHSRVSWAAWPFIFVIYAYRYTFAPILGGQCRFYPTCSHYAEDALRTHGALRGSMLSVKRLARCHPWHEGGFDPVPDREAK